MTDTPIIAGVATIPSREATFRRMLESVAPQVDRLHVYLSGYTGYLKDLSENCIQHKLEGDPYGDAGKFIGIILDHTWRGEEYPGDFYYLTFDDDLYYPPDYVSTLVQAIERYERKTVCSFHGRTFKRFPIGNYYRDAMLRHYCLRDVRRDIYVQVPGTGCLGFHTSTLGINMGDFPTRSMADVHLAVALRRAKVPAICLAHNADWIKHQPIDHGRSIYNLHKGDCREQTRRINEAFG